MTNPRKTVHQNCQDAVMAELISAGCAPDNPIDLYLVGSALVAAGYTEAQIVTALDSLSYEKRVEYAGGNRVCLTVSPEVPTTTQLPKSK